MISIVIPVYNSSKSLQILVYQITELEKNTDYDFEIIFVNDSPLNLETCEVLSSLEKSYSNVTTLTLRKNQGQHIALLVGIKQAVGDYIITMDDDLQHPVKEIPKLVKTISLNKNIEAIMAIPASGKKKHSKWRNLGSWFLNKIDSFFLDKPKGLKKGPFKIMTKDIAEHITTVYNATPSVNSLLIKATNQIINIEIDHENREFGKSGYTLKKVVSLFLNNILHYSSLPLKIIGMLGLLGFVFSIVFIIIVLSKKIFWSINFPGYASTVSLISFFGGLNLLGVGLIGEYLIRIVMEQQKIELKDLIKH